MTDFELEALWLSARLALFTVLICLPVAMVVASWAGRRRGRGRWVLDGLLLLPLCLSPAVVGWGVLRVFGADGPAGMPLFELFGWRLHLVPDGLMLVAIVIFWPESVTHWLDKESVVNTDDVRIEMQIEDTGGAVDVPMFPESGAAEAVPEVPAPEAGPAVNPGQAVEGEREKSR